MREYLAALLEWTPFLWAAVLLYFPVRRWLRVPMHKLLMVGLPLVLAVCLVMGWVCLYFSVSSVQLVPLAIALGCVAYSLLVKLSPWKTVSIALSVSAIFACFFGIARVIDAMLFRENLTGFLSIEAGLAYNLLCLISVALAAYPALRIDELLEEDWLAGTWYVFWILPLAFMAVNRFLVPDNRDILYQGRIMQGYLLLTCVLLFLFLLFVALFYFMAMGLNRNDRLRRENQLLQMQQSHYDNLQAVIAELRHARHDMRHHISTISGQLHQGETDSATQYVDELWENIPNHELSLCDNPALNGVLGHYAYLLRENRIPFFTNLKLPKELPVSDMDVCVVLSNLLENALEASLRSTSENRVVKLEAYCHSARVMVLAVENIFDGVVKEVDGEFRSSKRKGFGVGLQSVRHIAEKNGGYLEVLHENGLFRVNVMLRGNENSGR